MKNNKTIKFRVWDKIFNKWLVPNNDHPGNIYVYLQTSLGRLIVFEEYENKILLQQFIGLLDKNSKEIYEGDIINFETYGFSHGPERDYIKNAEVYYDEKLVSFCFGRFDSGEYKYTYQMTDRIDEKTMEIIGNVYETPELLNNKKNNE